MDNPSDARATSQAREPWYLADRFKWAAPGDQQEDAWIVRFCDADLRDMIFTGPDAEADARAAWNAHAPGYNMYVFRLLALPKSALAEGEERNRGMDEGATFVIENLAAQLKVTDYAQADGSEEWEGDVCGTIHNVLVAAGVVDDETRRIASLTPAPLEGDWVAVPRVPTEAMLKAGCCIPGVSLETGRRMWSAMLAALTPAPAAEDGWRDMTRSQVLAEARKVLRLTEGCLECNAEDERRWRETIVWLENLSC